MAVDKVNYPNKIFDLKRQTKAPSWHLSTLLINWIWRCFMFSDEELALIAAIHADPKNDAPRLAYADWLEKDSEHHHAEFIRLQCERPYVAISNRDPDNPHQSHSFRFSYDDESARA
jgi:uncharacterized protein (TIGR02996 family)